MADTRARVRAARRAAGADGARPPGADEREFIQEVLPARSRSYDEDHWRWSVVSEVLIDRLPFGTPPVTDVVAALPVSGLVGGSQAQPWVRGCAGRQCRP